jgi:hypothetical protein
MIHFYIFLTILSCFLVIITPYKNYSLNTWFYKSLLVYGAAFMIIYSIFKHNEIINNYLLPLLLFFNITILLSTIDKNNKYWNVINIVLLLYLLYIFNYKNFKVKNGKLINPNITWIISMIFILIFYYITSTSKKGVKYKYINILLILYPLLFPINEYFIHRVLSLSFATSISWYISNEILKDSRIYM